MMVSTVRLDLSDLDRLERLSCSLKARGLRDVVLRVQVGVRNDLNRTRSVKEVTHT
jgi:hypothetical protein